jgi:hypothetical protein
LAGAIPHCREYERRCERTDTTGDAGRREPVAKELTPYQRHMKQCLIGKRDETGSQRVKLKECAAQYTKRRKPKRG